MSESLEKKKCRKVDRKRVRKMFTPWKFYSSYAGEKKEMTFLLVDFAKRKKKGIARVKRRQLKRLTDS